MKLNRSAFPRPSRLASFLESFRFTLLPGQFLISQSPTDDLPHRCFEPLAIVLILAVVVAKCLFVYVAEQVKGLNRDIGTAESTLQK